MATRERKKVVDRSARDVDIKRQGTAVILPDKPPVTYDEAIAILKNKKQEEETVVAIDETLDAFPPDGAIAMCKAMKEHFGWTQMVPKMTFFGPRPPAMLAVRVGPAPTDVVRVPWGVFTLPGIEGNVEFGQVGKQGRLKFHVSGQCRQRDYRLIADLVDLARRICAKESIYRAKAIRFRNTSEYADMIQFMDVSGVDPEMLVLPEATEAEVQRSLFAPILYSDACSHYNVPVKRGVLLAGSYGVGKTMTAHVAAKFCGQVGRTFIYCEKAEDLTTAIHLAKQYLPACVFCEDIDRVTAGERDEAMNALANVIDGVETKNSEIVLVLTTNSVDAIHPVMLRPGRLDAVIPIPEPDANAAAKLVSNYAGSLLEATDAEMAEVGQTLAGNIPAAIREAVERAKLLAIYRTKGSKEGLKLVPDDLIAAANGLNAQIELLRPKKIDSTPQTRLYEAMAEVVRQALGKDHPKDVAQGVVSHELVARIAEEVHFLYEQA